jgi:D-alanyl-D-alanine carboxypeptidase
MLPARVLLLTLAAAAVFSCSRSAAAPHAEADPAAAAQALHSRVQAATAAADLPEAVAAELAAAAAADPARFDRDLRDALSGDAYLRALVDKRHALPADYEPADLEPLTASGYRLNRSGLALRTPAAQALASMGAAAEKDGVTLLVSSAYRSFEYQRGVYDRIVAQIGQEAADRESARPGHSQHQLGLAADFGSIDDAFAQTEAGRWLAVNAGRFGWSLSYPQSYEAVTGYRWESWHYRYVGPEIVTVADRYFGGIQQYTLAFLSVWM